MSTWAMSSRRPRNGLTQVAPALATRRAWAGEKHRVRLVRHPSSRRTRSALSPSTVVGSLTTTLGVIFASSRPWVIMPAVSVATTSALWAKMSATVSPPEITVEGERE